VSDVAQEVKEAPKGTSEDLFFEYLKDHGVEAYQFFLNVVTNLRKVVAEAANASEEDKVDAAFLLGRIFEDVELIENSLLDTERATDFYSPKVNNGIVEAVKALLKVYAALEKSPLYDINEDLLDFNYELSKAVIEYITGLSKWYKATNEALDKALNKA
jgi:hypothetical protein